MTMKVALIVAIDKERGIGKNNDLMWHLPADMQFFKATTSGHIVVTGRKNYDSIPERFRPLPNRENAVLTRNSHYEAPGALLFSSLDACLEHYRNETERTVFIIGGGQIYKEALAANVVDEMFITHVHGTFGADTFFPEIDANAWNSEIVSTHAKDEKHAYGFEILKYVRKS
ncbi:MAG: dihydrofolate reductase [Fluviicola sp.]|nr:dihydrofolate reductase [Fluviicola sp.]